MLVAALPSRIRRLRPSGRELGAFGAVRRVAGLLGLCALSPGPLRGVPDACPALPILSGAVDHMVPRPGQVEGILFEPIDVEHWVRTGERIPARARAEQPA